MKPRNKFERYVCEVQGQLPDLTPDMIKHGYDNSFESYFVESRNRIYCLECGHKFESPNPQKWMNDVLCECPSCGKQLKRIGENARSSSFYKTSSEYQKHAHMAVVTTVGDLQLVRIVYLNKTMKKKNESRFWHQEVIHQFICVDEGKDFMKMATFARTISYNGSGWVHYSDLSLKDAYPNDERYRIYVDTVFPKIKVMPIFKRNGFRNSFYGMNPTNFMYKLIHLSRFETLLKTKNINLLKVYAYRARNVEFYWPSIKIAIRNKYKIKDAGMWLDYLDLLHMFNKDLRNPVFICPKDLKAEHNKYVQLRQEQERVRREQDEIRQEKIKSEGLIKDAELYIKRMNPYFDLRLTDNDLIIEPLKTVDEFKEEGLELAHCVFVNEYYNKVNSLILSAKIDGKRTETIEVCTKTFEIIQSRGYDNEYTEHHDRILELVKSGINRIKQITHKIQNKNAKQNYIGEPENQVA